MTYRDNIDKLARRITDRIPAKVKKLSQTDPEYECLNEILNDEQCDLCLCFEVRKPLSFEEVVKRSGWPAGRVNRVLNEVCDIGMIEYNWENEDHHKQFVLPQFVPGAAEFMVMNKDLVEEHPIVADFFEKMTRLPLEKVTPMVPPGGAGIGMHVIPVEKAIHANQQAVSVEKISHWLNKYDKYALSPCSCRRQQRVRGEGTGDVEADVCIAVGDMADYVVQTNKGGHYCTYEEVIETLERCERKGYVHQITNIDGEDKIFAICNCAHGVCNALRTSQLFNTPNMSASAYRAHVDSEKCVACGKCVEICPVGAAKLGQKLCTKDGPVSYPKQELPDDVKWGPEKWNWNFRDTAKVNCYETGTSPCKSACPAHLPVQGYIKMAKEGRYMDALKLIKDFNPFPAVCGAICNRRCEQQCTRGLIDEPLAIDEIKKFIAEQELHEDKRYIPLCENVEGKFFTNKMAVIGAGPAGMSAAYYLRIMGYPVTIFEKEEKPGGMLVYGIPSFRLEKSVIEAEIEVLKAMGIEFKCGIEVGKDISLDDLRNEGYEAFYVAIGAQGSRKLNIPGEDNAMVESGIDFLRKVNKVEDPNLISGDVVVVGGDVYTGPKFAIDAISHGKEAAESMHRFVHKGHSLTIGRDLHLFNEFDKNNALIDIDFDHAKRQIPGIKKGLGEKSFRDLRSTFTEEQVKIEANRCLGCGASIVDTNKCIGCGLCTTKCEFDAIHLTRDIKDGARMVKAEDKMKAILPYAAKRQIKIIRNKKK